MKIASSGQPSLHTGELTTIQEPVSLSNHSTSRKDAAARPFFRLLRGHADWNTALTVSFGAKRVPATSRTTRAKLEPARRCAAIVLGFCGEKAARKARGYAGETLILIDEAVAAREPWRGCPHTRALPTHTRLPTG